jgi:hypothetical protein
MSDEVMVPRGPTEAMLTAGYEAWLNRDSKDGVSITRSVWSAMIAASTPPSVSTGSRPQEAVPTEQAEPAVVDDRLHDAIRQLRQHMTTIQAAKIASAAGHPQGMGPIWNLVNALPAIVRQLDAAELDIEAAFERYEDATPPSRKDRGGLDG